MTDKKTSLIVLLAIAAVMLTACSQRTEEAKIYVANEEGSSISVIGADSLKAIKTIELTDSKPHNVNVDPNGRRIYVTNHEEEENGMEMKHIPYLRVIDAKSHELLTSVMMPGMVAHAVPGRDGKLVYISAEESGEVLEVDAGKSAILRRFKTGHHPHGFVISNSGKTLYVPNMGTDDMSIIDIKSGTEERIKIGINGNKCETPVAAGITKDDKYVFVTCGKSFEVYKIDTATKKAIAVAEFTKGEYPGPIQTPVHPSEKYLYIPDMRNGVVHKIDIESFTLVKDIKAGNGAHGIAYSKDGKTAYVTNTWDGTLSVIDLESDKETAVIKVGENPNGVAVSNGKNQGW